MKKNYDIVFPDMRHELKDESILKQSQYVMLRILKIVADIFEENNITYWLDSGTLLGAVRHKGFIPWDDDIDIGILQSEYKNAVKVLKENLPDDLFLESLETDEYYDIPWIKIKDNNSCLIEDRPGKYHKGIFIDIFPFQEICRNNRKVFIQKKKIAKIYEVISRIKEPFSKRERVNNISYNLSKLLVKILFFPLLLCGNKRNNKMFRKVCDKAWKKTEEKGSGLLGYYAGISFFDIKIETSWMFPLKKLKFDDSEFYVPNDYDKYLTYQFGDYMTLPPEDQRISHNLNIIPDLRNKK